MCVIVCIQTAVLGGYAQRERRQMKKERLMHELCFSGEIYVIMENSF